MEQRHISSHRKSPKGFTEQLANEINRKQSEKVLRKMHATKMHAPKQKQGYTPNRSGVDTNTL
jgi:hypothetical protein